MHVPKDLKTMWNVKDLDKMRSKKFRKFNFKEHLYKTLWKMYKHFTIITAWHWLHVPSHEFMCENAKM